MIRGMVNLKFQFSFCLKSKELSDTYDLRSKNAG